MTRFGIIVGRPIYFVYNDDVFCCEVNYTQQRFITKPLYKSSSIYSQIIEKYDTAVCNTYKLLYKKTRPNYIINPENIETYLFKLFNNIIENTSEPNKIKLIYSFTFDITDFDDKYFIKNQKRKRIETSSNLSSKSSSKLCYKTLIKSEQPLDELNMDTLKFYKSQWNNEPVLIDLDEDKELILFDGNHRIAYLKKNPIQTYVNAFIVSK